MNETAADTPTSDANAKTKLSRWAEQRLTKLELVLGENFRKIQTARQGARQRLDSALGSLDATLEASLTRGERTANGWLESARGALAEPASEATSTNSSASA
jgi:BMFP domain-containing protein YqiC